MRNLDCFSHILPVPNRSFHAPLYVTNTGWERIAPNQPYPVSKAAIYMFQWEEGRALPDFCLALCTEGSGMLETRAGRENLKAGEGFLFLPGQWHRHRPTRSVGWTLLWVGFNGDLPHRWMSDGAFALKGSKPGIEDPRLFEAQFERLLRTSHRMPTRNSEELAWQTIGLLSHFLMDRNLEPTAQERGLKDIVSLAIEYIWNQTHTAISVMDVARHAGCSRRTLEYRFKETTGKTVLEEIQSCRADRARHLLESTDLPIKQIVFRSGFQSHEQMRKAFKKLFGKAPGELRNRE
jgi:AraC-like DNA-binding protein